MGLSIILGVLIGGSILIGILGYWSTYFRGKTGKELRKDFHRDEAGMFFTIFAWTFAIFLVAWILGTINVKYFNGHLFDFLND
jgi:hypothetical protein